MSEHSVAIVSFAGALKREVKRIRTRLQQVDDMRSFKISIEASGRVHDGEVLLSFGIADSEYSTPVRGDDLQAVLDEVLRRHGWNKVHTVKALAYEKIPSDDSAE